ncbi:MAG: FliH/SctL family protein [Acidobacteriota bacterium]
MSSRFVNPSQAQLLTFPTLQRDRRKRRRSGQGRERGEASPSGQREGGEARPDLSEIEREAFQKGYGAGERSGLEMANQKIESVLNRFSQSIEELAQLKRRAFVQVERDLVLLSVEIARKLVYREIRLDPIVMTAMVRVALEKLSRKGKVVIRVSPGDHKVLAERLRELVPEASEREVVLKSDKELDRGDCLIESDYGTVDARIAEQFDRIEKGLLGEF